MLAFAAEHRLVLAAQLAVLVDTTPAATSTRLLALTAAGYLRRERRILGERPCFQITTAGLRAAGSDLQRPHDLDLAGYRHDAGLGWLMVAAERGRFGALREIISERRMRSADRRSAGPAQRFGVRLGGIGPGGQDRVHYPDLLVVTETGHRIAFELELTPKAPARLEQILAGYSADRKLDLVVYLVDREATRSAVTRAAARLGVSSTLRVQTVRLGHGATRAGGGAGRSAESGRGRDAGRSPESRHGQDAGASGAELAR